MSAIMAPQFLFKAFDSNGIPLAGGKLYTYAAGTLTPLATYTDATGLVPTTNPIILDSLGQTTLWLGSSPYKFNLTSSTGVQQSGYPIDNVTPLNIASVTSGVLTQLASTTAGQGDSLIGVLSTLSNAVATNQHQINSERVSVFRWFSAAQIADVVSRTGSLDVSTAIMTGHTALVGTGKKLFFPAGVYGWGTAQTALHTLAWEGETPEINNTVHQSFGVQIKSTVTGAGNYALTVSPASFENGFYLRNIRFTGGNTASNGLYLTNIGNTGTIENVCVDSFTGWGINSGYIQDIKFWNLFILFCGTTAGTYGLGIGSISNLLHFYGGRIEACKGLIYADSVTGIIFDSLHIEEGTAIAYTSSPVAISSSTGIKFLGCFIGTSSVANLMALNSQTADAVVPLVSTVNCIDLIFDTTTFINNNGGGAKYLSIATNSYEQYSRVMGCSFQNQDCQTYGIVASYCNFFGNSIQLYDNGTTTNFKVAQLTYSECNENYVVCTNPSSATKVAGYIWQATAASIYNILGNNRVYVNKVYKYANTNWTTGNLGPTVVDSTAPVAGVLDLELFPENRVFYPGSNGITGLSNSKRGQIVTLYNSGYSCTITNGANLVLKGGVNATLASGYIMKLQNLNGDGIMYEISRNF